MTSNRSSRKPFPSLPWKTKLSIYALSALTDFSRRSDFTVNRRLFSFFDIQSSITTANPNQSVTTFDITTDSPRNLWLRLFLPSPAPTYRVPLIVYFHGGGFSFCSPASFAYDAFCRRISRELPAVVASVNYRLTPEHKFPAQYDDGIDALRFLDDKAVINSADFSSCFLVGDSAGGNIVHHVAKRWAASGDWKRVRVLGTVPIQPFFGGEERTESEIRLKREPLSSVDRADWYWKAFLPKGADRDHAAANVFGPREEGELEEGFPPAMVVVGGWDPLGDWQRRYCEGLRERGKMVRLVEYEEAVHLVYLFPELAESGELIEDMRSFIGEMKSLKGEMM